MLAIDVGPQMHRAKLSTLPGEFALPASGGHLFHCWPFSGASESSAAPVDSPASTRDACLACAAVSVHLQWKLWMLAITSLAVYRRALLWLSKKPWTNGVSRTVTSSARKLVVHSSAVCDTARALSTPRMVATCGSSGRGQRSASMWEPTARAVAGGRVFGCILDAAWLVGAHHLSISISDPANPPMISISHSAARSDSNLPSPRSYSRTRFTTFAIIAANTPVMTSAIIANEVSKSCHVKVTPT